MAQTKSKTLIPKVTSIADLFFRAKTDPRYVQLAIIAASNLGGCCGNDLDKYRQCFNDNATAEEECSEEGVVEEINFCRDLVK